jgi:hypothetical protein
MKSFKHGSALVAGVAGLIFSQAIGSSAAAACKATPITEEMLGNPLVMIQKYLVDNKDKVNTASDFVACLPAEYRDKNWIMITSTESAQEGDAKYPRILLTNEASTKVFGLELPSNPNANAPDEIEYLQFVDSTKNKFGFYSILTNKQKVIAGENAGGTKCSSCHFGRPNWDAYDSWAGMLPFNRDRVYQYGPVDPTTGNMADSIEYAAIKRIFTNLRITKPDPLFMQLTPPEGIENDGTITAFKKGAACNPPCFTDPGVPPDVTVEYKITGAGENQQVMYPGGSKTVVAQGGKFLTLKSSNPCAEADEGRGTGLFDNFTTELTNPCPAPGVINPGPNPKRIAQTILDYHGKDPAVVDVRYVALGIAKGCTEDFASSTVIAQLLKFQTDKDPKVTDFATLKANTDMLRKSLPQKKANLESLNLKSLMIANGGAFNPDVLNANIALRSRSQAPAAGEFEAASMTPWMIDRELYDQNTAIARFRLYLEPLPANSAGEELLVNRWSLSVRSRSNTYTFADRWDRYTTQLITVLTAADQLGNLGCPALAKASIAAFNSGRLK